MSGLPLDELARWGKDRRHFDATRDQPPMGQALLDLIDAYRARGTRIHDLRAALEQMPCRCYQGPCVRCMALAHDDEAAG